MSEWTKLRSFQGSQQAAFEELCCQLARRLAVQNGSSFIRKGAPDAGVECYWTLTDGTEHAWQAKFFLSVPAQAQWQQLRDSFATALQKHPRMTRYIVCIPLDRPDPRIQDRSSFAEKCVNPKGSNLNVCDYCPLEMSRCVSELQAGQRWHAKGLFDQIANIQV